VITMQRKVFVVLLACLLASLVLTNELAALSTPASLSLDAEVALLVDSDSGQVLFSLDAERRVYPASLTKILTALLALETCDLDEVVRVGEEVWLTPPDGSRAGLRPGDRLTLRELLYGLLLPSGNDAAYSIAVHVARRTMGETLTIQQALTYFQQLQGARLQQLGASDTHFVTPDGYHHPDHYTTAADLARVIRAALRWPEFRRIVGTALFRPPSVPGMIWRNSNVLLNPLAPEYFPAVTGLKTGTTPEAGYCLAATASADGINLLSLVLRSTRSGRWGDTRALLNAGLHGYSAVYLSRAGQTMALARQRGFWGFRHISLVAGETCRVLLRAGEQARIKPVIEWFPESLAAEGGERPILRRGLAAGSIVGSVSWLLDGELLGRTTLAINRRAWFWPQGVGNLRVVLGADSG
jgi:D-alanyl-D-alanine carboxypeptidase (penicillin-binding protein 5/6)